MSGTKPYIGEWKHLLLCHDKCDLESKEKIEQLNKLSSYQVKQIAPGSICTSSGHFYSFISK